MSSGLAGRAVARAFFTTYRPPVRDDDAAHLARGERVAIPYGRARLAGWSFGDGPAILLSHGWCGRAAQLAPIASALADAGFRALVFDHPGHGESSGRSATIPDMAFALAEADAFVGGAHAVVAHSMGAVVATLASSRTIRPRRLAYLAPPVVPERWLSTFTEKLGLGPAVLPSMRRAVEARAGIAITALDPLPIARASATPLLVVHDRWIARCRSRPARRSPRRGRAPSSWPPTASATIGSCASPRSPRAWRASWRRSSREAALSTRAHSVAAGFEILRARRSCRHEPHPHRAPPPALAVAAPAARRRRQLDHHPDDRRQARHGRHRRAHQRRGRG
ncbi:MAG: alpha/beta fold hydrolase [Myxococcota bacterium]